MHCKVLASGLLCAIWAFSGVRAAGGCRNLPESRVKWICPDEDFVRGIGKDRYYRTTVAVRAGLTNAVARWWFDDRGTLFVDGKAKRGPGKGRPCALTQELGSPGRHVLAVCGRNLAGAGGICLSLELFYADGTHEPVYTSDGWRCRLSEAEGWKTGEDDAADWAPVRILGDVTAQPWWSLADLHPMLLPDERRAVAAYEAWRAEALDRTVRRLEGEPKPDCRVVYEKGRARLDIGGRLFEPVLYNASQSWQDSNRKLLRQVAYFRDAGVHLYGLGVETADVWKPDGTIDFGAAERVMKSALAEDPEARFLFSINTVLPPRWWAETHPDELVGYQAAKVDFAQRDCRRNCAAASAASRVWRRDMADFERRLVGHLEASPFAARIFAYRTDWGINHEWHYYGMRGLFADNGKAMTAAFRDWLRARYGGDVSELRAAWKDADLSFETAQVPPPAARLVRSAGDLRDPVEDRPVLDYERCQAQMLRELVVTCDGAIKAACGGRALVGNYGGYYFGVADVAEGWHLENDAVLDDACVDFQCSPQVYGERSRRPGGVQYARCLLEGLRRRGKLSIQEADNSTAVSGVSYNRWSGDVEGDCALLARDFVQTLCWGCGFWYFDFGLGWYADPAFADFFKKILPVRSEEADCTSVSEVLVVGDYESVMFSHVDWPPTSLQNLMTDQVNELGGAGAPFDSASFADLSSGGLRDYKVYVFPNLYYVTPRKAAVVARLRAAGKRLVWLGPAGRLDANGVRARPWAAPGEIVSPDRALNRTELRALYRDWGVHVYNDDDAAAVYACASYVGLHNAKAGPKTIRLPQASRVTELYPERRSFGESLRAFTFEARGPATTLFRIDKMPLP